MFIDEIGSGEKRWRDRFPFRWRNMYRDVVPERVETIVIAYSVSAAL